MPTLLTPTQLSERAAAPDAAASPLADRLCLLMDNSQQDRVDESALIPWLATIPAPVIAVGGSVSTLTAACDVHVATLDEASKLMQAIALNPLAAAVLVQTLRVTERLDAEAGLVVESLAYASLQAGAEFRRWQAGFRAPPPSPVESGPAVLLNRDADRLRLRLNRPGSRNAMTVEMRDALMEALQLVLLDQDIATLEITAAGRCFSTGGELREFGTAPDPATAHAVRGLALPGRLLLKLAARSTIRVHGACVGSGIEFPAFAATLIARPDAWFQLPELRYGLIPGAGGTVSITRRIGRQRTAWLALSGQRIAAAKALEWGLVDKIES